MPIQVGLNLCLLKSAWFPTTWKNNPASLTSIFLHILTNQPFPLREEILRQTSFYKKCQQSMVDKPTYLPVKLTRDCNTAN